MMGTINACFIVLVLSSIGAIAKTKVFNDSAGLDEDAYYYNGRIDFYYFVQQWPATYCHWAGSRSDYCCSPQKGNAVPEFSIHGLWPTNYQGRSPQNCCYGNKNSVYCRQQFNPKKVPGLEDKLNWYWASIRYTGSQCLTKANFEFWRHEWEKHGTCSRLYWKQYFQNTISLRKREDINLLEALKTAGIKPNGNDYKLTDIEDAIQQSTGKHPRIRCNKNREGKSQLFEVFVCVELHAYKLMDCPPSQIYPLNHCDPNRVVFPFFGSK